MDEPVGKTETILGRLEGRDQADDVTRLLIRIANGDRAALKSLYELTAPRLFAVLRKSELSDDLAADLIKDVFVTIWKTAHRFDQWSSNPRAWLISVTTERASHSETPTSVPNSSVIGAARLVTVAQDELPEVA